MQRLVILTNKNAQIWYIFAQNFESKDKRPMTNGKFNIQIITAAILATGGLILLFCGAYIDPRGEISDSLLIGFGEVATFSGALFGIDAAYAKKLWDITNSSGTMDKGQRTMDKGQKKCEERSARSSTDIPAAQESTKSI